MTTDSEIIWLQTTFAGKPYRMSGWLSADGQPVFSQLQLFSRSGDRAKWVDSQNAKALAWLKPLLRARLETLRTKEQA